MPFAGIGALSRHRPDENDDHQDIAHRLGQHQHAQRGHRPGAHGDGNIEEEGKQDIQPHPPERPVLSPLPPIQQAHDAPENDEGNVPENPPGHVAAVLQPAALGKQAQCDAQGRQSVKGRSGPAFFIHPVNAFPDIEQQHIENRHRH